MKNAAAKYAAKESLRMSIFLSIMLFGCHCERKRSNLTVHNDLKSEIAAS